MTNARDYRNTFSVPATPAEAYDAAAHPERWWNVTIKGEAAAAGDTFVFDVPGLHHSEFTVTESAPAHRLVWRVRGSGAENEAQEWIGTDLVFEFRPAGDLTEVSFTHLGLRPELECHDVCTTAWNHHLDVGLREFLTTGTAQPLTPGTVDEVARKVGARPQR